MPRRVKHSRSVYLMTAVAAATGLGAVAVLAGAMNTSAASTAAAQDAFRSRDAATLLTRLGLGTSELAAAGLTPAQARQLAGATLAYQFGPDVRNATADLARVQAAATRPAPAPAATATATVNQPAAQASPPAADRDVAAARDRLRQRLDHAFAFATSQLAPEQRETLATLRANASQPVPVQYRVVNRTSAQWVALRGALVARRDAQARGAAVTQAVATLLAQADSEPAVSLAAGRVRDWEPTIRSNLQAALGTQAAPAPSDAP